MKEYPENSKKAEYPVDEKKILQRQIFKLEEKIKMLEQNTSGLLRVNQSLVRSMEILTNRVNTVQSLVGKNE